MIKKSDEEYEKMALQYVNKLWDDIFERIHTFVEEIFNDQDGKNAMFFCLISNLSLVITSNYVKNINEMSDTSINDVISEFVIKLKNSIKVMSVE